MSQALIFALHGFLGHSNDWNLVKKNLSKFEWITPNLFGPESLEISSFENLLKQLLKKYESVLKESSSRIFLGYSLGGRIGLHFLKNNPDLFDHYVFVSTNPGLETLKEKRLRQESDLFWADKVIHLPWDQFIKQWNDQPVFFGHSAEPKREHLDYSRKSLADSLINLSLSQQDDFRELIHKHQNKITWVVGEKDSKYLSLAEDLKQKKILLDYKRIFSGHRILFENSTELSKLIIALTKPLFVN